MGAEVHFRVKFIVRVVLSRIHAKVRVRFKVWF